MAERRRRQLTGVRFPLRIRGQVLEVEFGQESVTYSLREGDGLVIRHEDEEIRLSPETPSAMRPIGVLSKPKRRRKRKPRRQQKHR